MVSPLHPSLRRRWASGQPSGPTIADVLNSFGSDARAWWTVYDPSLPADPGLALTGSEVDTWTDQLNGFVMSAPGAGQRPSYATDGSNFGGRAVIQCAASGTRVLRANPLPSNLFTTGEFPWTVVVYRIRQDPASADGFVYILQGSSALRQTLFWENDGSRARAIMLGTQLDQGVSTADPNQRVASLAHDPSGIRVTQFPGVTTTNSGVTSGVQANVTQVGLAVANIALSTPSDVSIAEIICVDGWSVDRENALVPLVRAKWGI